MATRKWTDVRPENVEGLGGEAVVADAGLRNQSYIDAQRLAADEFLDILADATVSTETLTGAEQSFLTSVGGVRAGVFSPDRLADAQAMIGAAAGQADTAAVQDGYTTREVAQRFGWKTSNVRREVARRGLYVAGRARNREHVFPRWQFTESGPLPGLHEVLAVIPDDYHPLDVATFMTSSNEHLGGRSPVEWLAGGGPPAAVVGVAGELGYQ